MGGMGMRGEERAQEREIAGEAQAKLYRHDEDEITREQESDRGLES